jgi:ParB family transcriptional regulator, chromosome partitioning protein
VSDTTTAEPITLQAFVPADLRIAGNIRTDAEATITTKWVAQLKEHAKHSPLLYPAPDGTLVTCGNNTAVPIVRCPDGALEILFGARRTLGCIRAGVYLLGYIAGDKGDNQAARRARLIDQLTENTGREAMKRSDEAAAILRLIEDEDMTEAGIARATGLSKPEVAAYRDVARSRTAAKAADRWEFLTLDQAAILAEFENDEQAQTSLVQTARNNSAQFDQVVARLRATRDEREARTAFVAELEAQGTAFYGEGSRVPWTFALENLRDGDGHEITPEAHATCPGRAATITYEWDWAPGAEAAYRAAHGLADDDDLDGVEFASDEEAHQAGYAERWQISRHLCTDPEQYGHVNMYGAPETPTSEQRTAEDEDAEAAARTEERRRVRRRNTEWRAATEVRTRHLKALLARKAPPAGALMLIVEAMARNETQPLMSSFGHQTACELLGLKGDGAAASHRDLLMAELARASEKRAQVIALAMVLGAAEHGVRDVQSWQSAGRYWSGYDASRAARYLAWLAAHTDYPLSDIEAEVAADAAPRSDEPAEEAEGTEPDPGNDDAEIAAEIAAEETTEEWDSDDSSAYQDQVEAGQVTEEDDASAEAD